MNLDFFTESAVDIFLEVEVNSSSAHIFEADYEEATGNKPILGVGYQKQDNKYGRECRVYFNSDTDLSDEFSNIEIPIEVATRGYKEHLKFRANKCDFFWGLINLGYRLGKNE